MKKTKKIIVLNDLDKSKVVLDIEKDIEIITDENNSVIHVLIKAIVEKEKVEKKESINHTLNIKCEKITKKLISTPIVIKYDLTENLKFVNLIGKENLKKILSKSITFESGVFIKFNTRDISLEEIQKEKDMAVYDFSFKEELPTSDLEKQEGKYFYARYDVKTVVINSLKLNNLLLKKAKKILKKECPSLKINLYNNYLSFPVKENLEKFNIKLVGNFNNEDLYYLYELDTLFWDFRNNNIFFENYYLKNKFNFKSFVKGNVTNLCDITNKDILSVKEVLGLDIKNSNSNILKTLNQEIKKEFISIYKEEIEKLKKLFS